MRDLYPLTRRRFINGDDASRRCCGRMSRSAGCAAIDPRGLYWRWVAAS